MGENLVSTKEKDYLDEDKPIRGQNYCLVSFLSPEDILKEKEVYYFSRFIDKFGKDMKTLLDGIEAKYPDSVELVKTIRSNHDYVFNANDLDSQYKFFKANNSHEIETDFHKENDFKTSMRGIKIRGVFDTIDEAKTRSEFIKRQDNKFDIYICQVGCWCPWSPNPNDLTDQEYSETQLNTLMKQYKQNMDSKDELFEQRKAEMMSNTNSKSQVSNIADDLAGQSDPWIAAKQGKEEVKEEQTEVKEEPTEVKEEQTEVKEEEAVDIGRTSSD
jgi:hypothetical protein